MKTIALCQAFNESLFIERYLSWIYQCVDRIVISEGGLSPFANLPLKSTDNTRQIIENFKRDNDKENKIIITDTYFNENNTPPTREAWEGLNKNQMLQLAQPQNGDIIFIGDIDEFWDQNRFASIIDLFKQNDSWLHAPVEEWQFAYGLKYCFKASHDGRFMRYRPGAHFGDTNHFFVSGQDVTKDYRHLQERAKTNMIHLCWSKHPLQIREKCISYARPSLETWFNFVYIQWPFNPSAAYHNNKQIPPYHGSGYAEGQHNELVLYDGQLPDALKDMQLDWMDYIKENGKQLFIKVD